MVLQGLSSQYYFGGASLFSRGPWWREFWIDDDGLDWFLRFTDNDGNFNYLLTNNLPLRDREQLYGLYKTSVRNHRISSFIGLWVGFELVTKLRYCKSSALGWRFVQWLAMSFAVKEGLTAYSAYYHQPIIGAFLRKYAHVIKKDPFEIRDEKKEYFYIDTSQYMAYSNADLSDEYHVHHSPQPVSF